MCDDLVTEGQQTLPSIGISRCYPGSQCSSFVVRNAFSTYNDSGIFISCWILSGDKIVRQLVVSIKTKPFFLFFRRWTRYEVKFRSCVLILLGRVLAVLSTDSDLPEDTDWIEILVGRDPCPFCLILRELRNLQISLVTSRHYYVFS